MNFSPFYYHVQDLIAKDNDKAIREIFNNPEQKEEFKSYYEDFIHCTYPNSFKCLYFLMNDVVLRYDAHSLFFHSFKDNNTEWLTFFFDNYQKLVEHKKDNAFTVSDFFKRQLEINTLTMSINLDYNQLLTSSQEIWDIMFKYENCNIFKHNMLLNEMFNNDDISKISDFENLCLKYSIEVPVKDIVNKSLYSGNIDLAEFFLNKYQPQFSNADLTDLINMVGLSDNITVFQFFNQHILPLEEFNSEQKSLVFNGGLLLRNSILMDYLKTTYNIDFYPTNKVLKDFFISSRKTMWEDNNEKCSLTMDFLQDIHSLFKKHNWNIEELKKELEYHDEISKIFSQIELNDKLNLRLNHKNISNHKAKI